MSITDIIKPITLLSGSHEDIGTTGRGCIMNVIAYLNGEAQITDDSPCVCVSIKRPLIWFNDFLRQDERQDLIQYIERAMGSATQDFDVVRKRLDLLVVFAEKMSAYAAANAANAANAAAAAANAAYAAAYAAAGCAADCAASAANAAANAANAAANAAFAASATAFAASATANVGNVEAMRHDIKKIAFEFFNAALPPAPKFDDCVLSRAKELAELV